MLKIFPPFVQLSLDLFPFRPEGLEPWLLVSLGALASVVIEGTEMAPFPYQSLGREVPLEKAMASHSSTLAWKIPWMEEPGGLQYMGDRKSVV